MEFAEALDLAVLRRRVAQQCEQRARQVCWRGLVLQQLRHQALAGKDVGHADVRQVEHLAHQRPCYRRLAVGDDHRRLEERRFERRRAARDEREVGGGERVVRMAEEQRQRQIGALVLMDRALEHFARLARHHRADEMHLRHFLAEAVRGEHEGARHVLQLGAPAPRQQRHDQLARRQAQLRARLVLRRLERDHVGERMADIGDRHACGFVNRRLERKHHQHAVHRARDAPHAPAAPGPDGWTYIVDGGYAAVL